MNLAQRYLISSIFASLLLLLTLSGCGDSSGSATAPSGSSSSTLSSSSGTTAVPITRDDTLFLPAKALYDAKDYAGAITTLRELKNTAPPFGDLGKLEYYIGRSFFKAGQYDSALAVLEPMFDDSAMDPWRDGALLTAGQTRYALGATDPGQYRTALGLYDRIFAEHASSGLISEAWYEGGKAYRALAVTTPALKDSALVWFQTSVTTDPTAAAAAGANQGAGDILLSRSDWTGALAHFEAVLASWPTGIFADNALYGLGRASFENANYTRSDSAFTAYLSTYPTGGLINNAHYWRGRANQLNALADTTGDPTFHANAIVDFDYYLQNNPTGSYAVESRLYLGMERFYTADWSLARIELAQVETMSPTSPDIPVALYYLGRTDMGEANVATSSPLNNPLWPNAITKFRRILSDFSTSIRVDDAQFQIGKSFYRMGEPDPNIINNFTPQDRNMLDSAKVQLEFALSSSPGSPKNDNTLLYLVRTYSELAFYSSTYCTEANNYLVQMQTNHTGSILLPYAQNHSSLKQNCP